MELKILEAVNIFNQGGIVIFPTDTAFGIGCRIDHVDSIDRLFEIRRRDPKKATPVLVSSIEMAQEFLQPIDEKIRSNVLEKYWPGGLTVVLEAKSSQVPEKVRGGSNTLGVRMPNHPALLQLIEKVSVPILAPSANFSGESTPYSMQDLDKSLLKLVDYVLPGKTYTQQASTVIDCSVTPWKVLRKGAVDIKL